MVNESPDSAWFDAQEAEAESRLREAVAEEAAAIERRVLAEQILQALRVLKAAGLGGMPRGAPRDNVQTTQPLSPTAPTSPADGETWPEVITALLRDSHTGMTSREMLAKLAGTPWGEKYKRQPNSFHNTLARLTSADRLHREGKHFFHPVIYEKIYAGEIARPVVDDDASDRIPDRIIGILKASDGPMKAGDIIAKLREDSDINARIGPLAELAYSHLSKISRRGDLKRVGGGYDLPDRPAPSGNVVPMGSKSGGQT